MTSFRFSSPEPFVGLVVRRPFMVINRHARRSELANSWLLGAVARLLLAGNNIKYT